MCFCFVILWCREQARQRCDKLCESPATVPLSMVFFPAQNWAIETRCVQQGAEAFYGMTRWRHLRRMEYSVPQMIFADVTLMTYIICKLARNCGFAIINDGILINIAVIWRFIYLFIHALKSLVVCSQLFCRERWAMPCAFPGSRRIQVLRQLANSSLGAEIIHSIDQNTDTARRPTSVTIRRSVFPELNSQLN